MKMIPLNKLNLVLAGASILSLAWAAAPHTALAEDSAQANVKEAGRDLKKNAKKTVRKVKDKTCEMVDGKMQCAKKKIEHKMENMGDDIKDKADDITK